MKLHQLHPGVPLNGQYTHTARCWRSVKRNQIAAFDTGVTCRQCRKAMDWAAEHDAERSKT